MAYAAYSNFDPQRVTVPKNDLPSIEFDHPLSPADFALAPSTIAFPVLGIAWLGQEAPRNALKNVEELSTLKPAYAGICWAKEV